MKGRPVITYTSQHLKEVRKVTTSPCEQQENIGVLYKVQANQINVYSQSLRRVFVCSTICSQILQDPTATSGQYLCRLGPASRTQRYHYWIFPQVPDRYINSTSDPRSPPSQTTRSKHNVIFCSPPRRNSKALITEEERFISLKVST